MGTCGGFSAWVYEKELIILGCGARTQQPNGCTSLAREKKNFFLLYPPLHRSFLKRRRKKKGAIFFDYSRFFSVFIFYIFYGVINWLGPDGREHHAVAQTA